jgi:CubicO group peptidase (beta-lactamase class C family)
MRGFGNADLAGLEPTQPYHMFRIASISKSITSIAIMKLVENGQLSLSDKAFGPTGRLASHPYLGSVSYSDTRINDITVQHLLEHSGGWNSSINCVSGPAAPYLWNPGHCDPIGFPLHVTQTLGEANPVTGAMHIRFLMEKGLNFAPGTQYAYSNIGFLVLGEIIAMVSGKSYEAYVKDEILSPLGIYDMHIGRSRLTDKMEREAEYIGNGYTAPSCYGTGQTVPWEYGGWNLEAMDAHGGWIATPRDMVRLLVAIDGFSTKPDILSAASISTMTTASTTQFNYAKGWNVNSANNWWHLGALDGTASLWVRSSGGYTWAVILNKRVIDNSANAFWSAFDNLPWNCIAQTSTWPTHDLLASPLHNSKDLVFSGNGSTDLTVSWTNGDGENRLLVAREEHSVSEFPLDGQDYTANAAFAMGDPLGNGNYVVYNGTGNSATVTGLEAGKTYHFRLFEYNQNAATGNHALYLLGGSPQDSATTASSTSLAGLQQAGIHFYPNPARDYVRIELDAAAQCDRMQLRNMHGQLVRTIPIPVAAMDIPFGDLPPQIYLISFYYRETLLGSARLLKH